MYCSNYINDFVWSCEAHYKENYKSGICNCSNICKGDGKLGCCKKITIAVFNSGKIIITGGRNMTQCIEAYSFIYKILNDDKENLIDK